MIIQRYLLRDILATFAGVALLLSLIFLSGTFVRILSEAAAGTYPATVVLKLFALKGIGNLVFILPLAFFLSVLLALGRFYRDSEMAVLAACGIGPGRIYEVVGKLAVVVAALLAILAFYFAPWAEERSYQILDQAGARSELDGLAAGRFNKVGVQGELSRASRRTAKRWTTCLPLPVLTVGAHCCRPPMPVSRSTRTTGHAIWCSSTAIAMKAIPARRTTRSYRFASMVSAW